MTPGSILSVRTKSRHTFDQDHTASEAGADSSPSSVTEEPALLVTPAHWPLESQTIRMSPAGSGTPEYTTCVSERHWCLVPDAKATPLLALVFANNQSGFTLSSMTT